MDERKALLIRVGDTIALARNEICYYREQVPASAPRKIVAGTVGNVTRKWFQVNPKTGERTCFSICVAFPHLAIRAESVDGSVENLIPHVQLHVKYISHDGPLVLEH
jgi:hypothetical protein